MSKLNDWLQVLASIGVLIGIFLVLFEIRQNNDLAFAEFRTASLSRWEELSRIELETNIKEIFAKSLEEPEELTTAEILKLDSWLVNIISIHQINVTLYELGLGIDPTEVIKNDAGFYFGGRFARAWFEENKDWISMTTPMLTDVIGREIESTPVQTEYEYLERLKSRLLQ